MSARTQDDIVYYDRHSGELRKETVMGEWFIRWMYGRRRQPWFAPLLFRSSLLSHLYGCYQNSPWSARKIRRIINELGVDPTEFIDPPDSFPSFNAFFTRKLRPECRPFDRGPEALVSPADGRLLVYPGIDGDRVLPVKGIPFLLSNLIEYGMERFLGGDVVVVRLCPADYHRFHFPCDGRIEYFVPTPGNYHSVNPLAIASNLPIFAENKRCCTLLNSPVFGSIAIVEVGAFGVGSIVQTWNGHSVAKMDEKGYFQFGGSTLILAFQKGRVKIAADLIDHSDEGYETLVKVGETIGHAGGG